VQQAAPVITVLAPPEPTELDRIPLLAQLAGFLSFKGNCTLITSRSGASVMPIFPSGTEIQLKGGKYYIVNRGAKLKLRYNSNVVLGGGFGSGATDLKFAVRQEGCGDFFVVNSQD
jgi:hypothetical protein